MKKCVITLAMAVWPMFSTPLTAEETCRFLCTNGETAPFLKNVILPQGMDELPGRFEEVRSSGGTLIVPFLALYQKRFYGNGNSTEVAAVFNGGDTIRFRISFGF